MVPHPGAGPQPEARDAAISTQMEVRGRDTCARRARCQPRGRAADTRRGLYSMLSRSFPATVIQSSVRGEPALANGSAPHLPRGMAIRRPVKPRISVCSRFGQSAKALIGDRKTQCRTERFRFSRAGPGRWPHGQSDCSNPKPVSGWPSPRAPQPGEVRNVYGGSYPSRHSSDQCGVPRHANTGPVTQSVKSTHEDDKGRKDKRVKRPHTTATGSSRAGAESIQEAGIGGHGAGPPE